MTGRAPAGLDGTPTADRRLGPYTVLAVAGLIAALITGHAAFAAVAAPAAVLVVTALADRHPLVVEMTRVDAPARVLEGDRWTLGVTLAWTGDAEFDVAHTGMPGSSIVGAAGRTIRAEDGAELRLDAEASRWGRHGLGSLAIRARRPGGMLRWDHRIELPGTVRVLPHATRLDQLLAPSRPRIAAGSHLAPVRGTGTDFADLRPYAPGDRLRDLSWSASLRSEQPWVVVHHPERSATVVLLLDTFVEVGAPAGSLDRAARVVWSIARHHLAAGDRIGVLATGAAPTWLSPVAGRRARWQVLDALLGVGASAAGAPSSSHRRPTEPRTTFGTDAVVVGVSPLQSDSFVAAVVHHRRLGRPSVVVGVETGDLLPAPTGAVERAARRLWALDAEARRADLGRAGVPSVVVADDPAPAVRLLAARTPRPARGAA